MWLTNIVIKLLVNILIILIKSLNKVFLIISNNCSPYMVEMRNTNVSTNFEVN